MDIPHTITWRSVVLKRISKPEINRPKLVKLLSTKRKEKDIQSNHDSYATEQNTAEGSCPATCDKRAEKTWWTTRGNE